MRTPGCGFDATACTPVVPSLLLPGVLGGVPGVLPGLEPGMMPLGVSHAEERAWMPDGASEERRARRSLVPLTVLGIGCGSGVPLATSGGFGVGCCGATTTVAAPGGVTITGE